MGTAIERYEARKVELSYLQTVGEVLAKSHFFDDAQTAERAVAKILAGQEFGMGALEAMRAFHVIDGKVEMSADAQARLVKASDKYDYAVVELTDDACEIAFFQSDLGDIGNSRFTIADAERAGIVKKEGAWSKYPRNMLFARALTNGVAWFCPDAISGGRVYSPGEVSDEVWDLPTSEVSVELEPVVGSATHEADGGMGETGGSDAARPSGAVAVSDPTREESAAYGEGAADSHEPRILSSQRKQLLRHAVDLRWMDKDISAAIDEAYPGLTELSELTQEQARALIGEWGKLVKATRATREQKDRLKPLASNSDAIARAQFLFGADHIHGIGDLTVAEAEALISDLEAIREGAA